MRKFYVFHINWLGLFLLNALAIHSEQLSELIEFVARAIMLQARPSGDDDIVGRKSSQAPAPLSEPIFSFGIFVCLRAFCTQTL